MIQIIATVDLKKEDIPRIFKWPSFSKFATTFDPLIEAQDLKNQLPTTENPTQENSLVALRYFLYCWQRIGNNQGGLDIKTAQKIQLALDLLREKVGLV
jgi:hypothetical protein